MPKLTLEKQYDVQMLQLQRVVGGIYKTLLLQVVQVKSYSQFCLKNFLLLNIIRQARKIQSEVVIYRLTHYNDSELPESPPTSKKSKTNAGVRPFKIYHFAFMKDHMTEYVRCDHFVWFAPFS